MPNSRSLSSVLVIGAGLGGIAAAIELQRHGFSDITILDAAHASGGTWLHNDYPGAACDIPSQFYSYSYAQRRDWVRVCTPQPEILSYIREVAAEFGVDRLMRFGVQVDRCEWSDTAQQWTVTAADGETFTADSLIVATGQLHQPMVPSIPGLEGFGGTQFHSARWNHDYDLTGKRVAVIGTGASAVQFAPVVAEQAAKMTVFQRTGNWFMPRRNRPYPRPLRLAIEHLPGFQSLRRAGIRFGVEQLTRAIRNPRRFGLVLRAASTAFMRWQLRGDPELRRKVWPDYTFGCKRILFSSFFLPTLRRDNVELETGSIREITADAVVTADGTRHEVDCIIFGTGFKTNDFMFPMEITGSRGASLREQWAGGAHAHLGITVPGFPSLFLLYGPNTNTSGGSIIQFLEWQSAYVRQALQLVARRGAGAIEVRADVEAASDAELQAAFDGTAWLQCDSWYRNDQGRIVTNWPYYMKDYEARTRRLDPTDFTLLPASARAAEPAA